MVFCVDIKMLYLDAQDIQDGLYDDHRLHELKRSAADLLVKIKSLIDICEFADDESTRSDPLTREHVLQLTEILAGDDSCPLPEAVHKQMDMMLMDGRFLFGNEWMSILLKRLGPLKQRLHTYIQQLRKVALSQ
jgi:hypothetical protein